MLFILSAQFLHNNLVKFCCARLNIFKLCTLKTLILKGIVNDKIKCRKSVKINVGFPTFLISVTITIEVIVNMNMENENKLRNMLKEMIRLNIKPNFAALGREYGCDKAPPKICYEKWIKKELEYIDNKLYIIIGAKAAKTFFPNEDYNDLIFKNNILFNKPAIVLPHPSPLNIKWFKDNPDFIKKRIIEIRKIINNTLNKN